MIILVLVVSAILIVVGSYIASCVAEGLQYHYSDTLIAGFIALLQTLPEYAFIIILTLAGHFDYALMSIVGANILLVALGFPVIVFIGYISKVRGIRKDKSLDLLRENSVESIFLAISGVYMVYLGLKGDIDIVDGVVLLIVFVVYMFIITHLPPEVEEEEPKKLARFFAERKKIGLVAIIVGAIVIWYSAEVFTEGILEFSKQYVGSAIILVTVLMPLVSEFPEKLTAYIGAARNEDMARLGVANFMSSRINNGTLLFSSMMLTLYLAHGGTVVSLHTADFPMLPKLMIMAGILSLLGALTTIDRRITVMESIALFLVYIVLMYSLIHLEFLVYADMLMVIILAIILGYALKDRRFFWWSDLTYTLRELKFRKANQ